MGAMGAMGAAGARSAVGAMERNVMMHHDRGHEPARAAGEVQGNWQIA